MKAVLEITQLQVVQRFPIRSGNKPQQSRALPTMHVTGRKKVSVSISFLHMARLKWGIRIDKDIY